MEVDCSTGPEPRLQMVMSVKKDGRNAEVGTDLDSDERIDCAGKTLLPGLFDTHVHLVSRYEDFEENPRAPRAVLGAVLPGGREHAEEPRLRAYTTVRDAAGADAGMRLAVEEGSLVGPRMQLSVTMLSMTGGHNDPWLPSGGTGAWGQSYPGMPSGVCDGVDGVAAKVREVVRAGADVIKIASSGGFLSPADDPSQPNFSQHEVESIVRTAADLGRWVMSHAHGPEGIKRAIRAGVRSIDHGTYSTTRDPADAGSWHVARSHSHRGRHHRGDRREPARRGARAGQDAGARPARARRVPPSCGGGREDRDGHRLSGRPSRHEPPRARAHDVERLHPEQALVAATTSAAELMGLETELGTLEAGKRADVVVVDGDPFDFATLHDRIEQVWKDGVRVV